MAYIELVDRPQPEYDDEDVYEADDAADANDDIEDAEIVEEETKEK